MNFRKAEYIKDFSEKITTGEFDLDAVEKMSDRQAIDALVDLIGIGVWTAEMILLFCLQRPDILSFGDLAVLRGMRMVYRHREIDRKQFEKYRKRLSPYGSVASLYFWAVAGGALPELTDPAPAKKSAKGTRKKRGMKKSRPCRKERHPVTGCSMWPSAPQGSCVCQAVLRNRCRKMWNFMTIWLMHCTIGTVRANDASLKIGKENMNHERNNCTV